MLVEYNTYIDIINVNKIIEQPEYRFYFINLHNMSNGEHNIFYQTRKLVNYNILNGFMNGPCTVWRMDGSIASQYNYESLCDNPKNIDSSYPGNKRCSESVQHSPKRIKTCNLVL